MEAKVIAIGNAQGIRLPKAILRRCRLAPGQAVEIDVRGNTIVISPRATPREGWEAAFARSRPRAVEDLCKGIPPGEGWDK
ncbi:MAG: AbrB/MazE/SpoVT family DNA-binding domain-containing protein [Burkholderiales bacterium]|nr:AbrB/MazE/SpoVT family DNA-binding domain-containing protein [Burkholderiales bacterium]